MITLPFVSAATAGVLVIVQMLLLFAVVIQRRRHGQSLGEGGDPAVQRAVRRHGNFAENAALFVAAFALFELLGGPRQTLMILCAVFLAARLSHAIGLSLANTVNVFRIAGILGTVGVGLTLGVWLIGLAAPHLSL